VRLIQIGLGIRDLRDRASVCAGRDERFSERNALPGLWRQRTTALDLDHGSLTLFSILLNALPFIHSIPIKSPAPARWLDVPSQSPGLGVTYTWDHCLPQSEPRTATLRN
jgi:hypothetical protein